MANRTVISIIKLLELGELNNLEETIAPDHPMSAPLPDCNNIIVIKSIEVIKKIIKQA